MPLTEELKLAATNLGTTLAASPEMQELSLPREISTDDGSSERQIEIVKALFTRTAQRLSTTLGVRYTDFAR